MAHFIEFEKSLVNGMLVGVQNGKRVVLNPRIVVRDLDLMDRVGQRNAQSEFNARTGMWRIRVGYPQFKRGYLIFAKLLKEIEGMTDDRHMHRWQKPASKGADIAALAKFLGHRVQVNREFEPIGLSDEDKQKIALIPADELNPQWAAWFYGLREQQLVEDVAAVVEAAPAVEAAVEVKPKRVRRSRKAAVQVEQAVLA